MKDLTKVKCENCGTMLKVPLDQQVGRCPKCNAHLIFYFEELPTPKNSLKGGTKDNPS